MVGRSGDGEWRWLYGPPWKQLSSVCWWQNSNLCALFSDRMDLFSSVVECGWNMAFVLVKYLTVHFCDVAVSPHCYVSNVATLKCTLTAVHLPWSFFVKLMLLNYFPPFDLYLTETCFRCDGHCPLTLSSPVVPNGYTSKCSGPYWSNPPF